MNADKIFEGLKSEEWNYEAKIIPRSKIRETLETKILNEAESFVCLLTPYWTPTAVNMFNLRYHFEELKKRAIKIYLFSRIEANSKEYAKNQNNFTLFNEFFHDLGIKNCWLVKNLHSKLYYNEKYILLSSANLTASSLGLTYGRFINNYEEGVLLKLKDIKYDKNGYLIFSNLNPFDIPPFYAIQNLKEIPKGRFLLNILGKHETSKIEIPSIFSFPDMMEDWLLSVETIKTYNRSEFGKKDIIHIGEKENYCPVCKSKECDYSRTFICQRNGIEYPEIAKHCSFFFECEFAPDFKTHKFYDQKCPISVFYCPEKNCFYDPSRDAEYFKNESLLAINENLETFMNSDSLDINEFILYCPNCQKILIEQGEVIYFSDFDFTKPIELYKCSDCNNSYITMCPNCDTGFPNINLSSEYFKCNKVNREFHYRIE